MLVIIGLGGFAGWELASRFGGTWLGIAGIVGGAVAVVGLLFLSSYIAYPEGAGQKGEDGKQEGMWVWRHRKGQPKREAAFVHGVLHGAEVVYYLNGQKRSEGRNHEGRPEGTWIGWHSDGSKASEGEFRQGVREGDWGYFWPGGKLRAQASYRQGVLHGLFKEWNEDGALRREERFLHGVPVARGFCRVCNPEPASAKSLWMYLLCAGFLGLFAIAFSRNIFLFTVIMLFFVALIIHEFGHFLAAKLVGIPVDCFRIGIGPRLSGFLLGETRFEICLFPVLGWVQPFRMRPVELAHYQECRAALARDQGLPELPQGEAVETSKPASDLVSRPRRLLFVSGGLVFSFSAAVLSAWAMLMLMARDEGAEISPAAVLVQAGEWTCQMTALVFEIVPTALLEQFSPRQLTTPEPGPVAQLSTDMARVASADDPAAPTTNLVWSILLAFAALNTALFCLNVLPIPPLDGFHGLRVVGEIILRRDLPDHYLIPLTVLGGILLLYVLLLTTVSLVKDLVITVFA